MNLGKKPFRDSVQTLVKREKERSTVISNFTLPLSVPTAVVGGGAEDAVGDGVAQRHVRAQRLPRRAHAAAAGTDLRRPLAEVVRSAR